MSISDDNQKYILDLLHEYEEKRLSLEALARCLTLKNRMDLIPQDSLNKSEELIESTSLISVVIPTYNRKDLLKIAISSVLEQEYLNIEILIIDDCSTDGTELMINDLYQQDERIKYYRNQTNKGPGFNRLYGFNQANGEYIIFLDDDDYYIDSLFFKKAITYLMLNPGAAFVSADCIQFNRFNHDLSIIKTNLPTRVDKEIYLINFQTERYPKPISTFTTIFKKSVLNQVEIEEMKMVNDTTIYLRALLGGDAGFISDIIGVYQIHNNLSFNCKLPFIIANIKEKFEVMKFAKKRHLTDLTILNDWIYNQTLLTFDYFIKFSPTTVVDYYQIIEWGVKNLPTKKISFFISIIKRFIKRKFESNSL